MMSSRIQHLLIVLLLVSLAGNIYFLGFSVGRDTATPKLHPRKTHMVAPSLSMRRLARVLPDEDKRRLRTMFAARRDQLRALHVERKLAEEKIKSLLLEKNVDRIKLESAMVRHAGVMSSAADPLRKLILDFLPGLELSVRERAVKVLFDRHRIGHRLRDHQRQYRGHRQADDRPRKPYKKDGDDGTQ